MYRIAFGFLLALAGCAAPAPQTVIRDGSVAISSAALFDAARFAGDWHVVAAYGAEAGCGPLRESWSVTGPGRYDVTGTRCAAPGLRRFDATAQISGPGRITRAGSEPLWVLWVEHLPAHLGASFRVTRARAAIYSRRRGTFWTLTDTTYLGWFC
jgi:apolipoprotein D and lipocalin family protein